MYHQIINSEPAVFLSSLIAALVFMFLSWGSFKFANSKENHGAFLLGLVCLIASSYLAMLALESFKRLSGGN